MTSPLPLFDITDVEAISGETYIDPEIAQVNRFIAIATAKMRQKVPDIDTRIGTLELSADIVKGIGADVVIRALSSARRDPNVSRVEYPEWSEQYFGSGQATRSVYLLDEEITELSSDAAETSGGAFSIRIG